MVPLQLPILLDQPPVEPREEEDGDKKRDGSTNADDHTGSLRISERDSAGTTLPHDKHCASQYRQASYYGGGPTGEQSRGDAKVNGNGDESLQNRVLTLHDSVLCEEEDDGTEGTGQKRRNDPGKEDLDNTGVDVSSPPLDAIGSQSSNAHTDHSAHDGVSGRDRHTETGGDGEVDGRRGDSADHTQHQQGWVLLEGLDVDDLGSDGICDTSTYTNTIAESLVSSKWLYDTCTGADIPSTEFHDSSQDHGLPVLQ